MKNILPAALLIVLFLAAGAVSVSAQDGMQPGSGPMMGQGMMGQGMMGPHMQGMMGGGMMGSGMMGGGEMGMLGNMPIERLKSQLDLTDQQVSQLRNYRLEYLKSTAHLRADLQIAQAELDILLSQDRLNMQEIEKKVRALQEIRGNIQIQSIRHMAAMRNVLTPEQRQKLNSMPGQGPGAAGPGSGRQPAQDEHGH